MQGKLIVIDGTDGSGKGTLTRMLSERLAAKGHPISSASFPTYGTQSCRPVEAYLNGDFGSAEFVGPYLATALFAFNRAKEMPAIEERRAKGVHFLMNRYVASNAGHQAGKVADPEERRRFIAWLLEFEHDLLKSPRPDCTIILHLPPAIGQQFLALKRKEERAYLTGGKEKDIHEADLSHLERAEHAFLEAASVAGWHVVECARSGISRERIADASIPPEEKARPLSEICDELVAIVEPLLGPIRSKR